MLNPVTEPEDFLRIGFWAIDCCDRAGFSHSGYFFIVAGGRDGVEILRVSGDWVNRPIAGELGSSHRFSHRGIGVAIATTQRNAHFC
ncbi:hypothetical protein [Phormidium sp. CCY1219]|uniref:hypothetical protein n=1 Tax=Phormidium sp. CCY1219 TaxID=2886104 RepID=UPI002D1F981A|nr:hypothetical protein [Phormidium sp. CCY1219]MEB3826274.1 hypothetical protein [Phormidium sp. CCY1219]